MEQIPPEECTSKLFEAVIYQLQRARLYFTWNHIGE